MLENPQQPTLYYEMIEISAFFYFYKHNNLLRDTVKSFPQWQVKNNLCYEAEVLFAVHFNRKQMFYYIFSNVRPGFH